MKTLKPYWIKERKNPKLGTYYVCYGQMSRTAAKEYMRGTLYGSNQMHEYPNEKSYLAAVEELKKQGERIQ